MGRIPKARAGSSRGRARQTAAGSALYDSSQRGRTASLTGGSAAPGQRLRNITHTEFRFVSLILRGPGVVSYREIAADLWPGRPLDQSLRCLIRNYVAALRRCGFDFDNNRGLGLSVSATPWGGSGWSLTRAWSSEDDWERQQSLIQYLERGSSRAASGPMGADATVAPETDEMLEEHLGLSSVAV